MKPHAFSVFFAWIKKEAVLSAAVLGAAVSAFFVPPSKTYLSYIDWNTLCILFALMAVIAALRSCGVFATLGALLCRRLTGVRALSGVLVALCFFSSMLITNDVALLTFVPFTLSLLVPVATGGTVMYVVILQTIAANTGSMLTPLGNPQNLFLFQQTGLPVLDFFQTMLPFTVLAAALLAAGVFFVPDAPVNAVSEARHTHVRETKRIVVYSLLFVLCLLSVFRMLPKPVAAGAVALVLFFIDRKLLLQVDYLLLCTFGAFFVFTGNLSALPAVHSALAAAVSGHEFASAVCASQIISNVPATLLLYPFTGAAQVRALLIGVNAGGLGTLVASLASLISYKLYMGAQKSAVATPEGKMLPSGARYLGLFTVCNILALAFQVALYMLLK